MKKITAIICCVLMLTFVLAGCGGSKYKDSQFLGKWSASICEYEGFEMEVSQVIGQFDFELTEDGKFSANVGGATQDGTWEEVDGGICMDGDENMSFKGDGNKLALESDGVTIYFEKQ